MPYLSNCKINESGAEVLLSPQVYNPETKRYDFSHSGILYVKYITGWRDLIETCRKESILWCEYARYKLCKLVKGCSWKIVQRATHQGLEDRVWHLWKKKPFDWGSGLSSPLFLSNGKYILGIIPYHKSSLSLNQVQFISQIEVSSDFSLFIE